MKIKKMNSYLLFLLKSTLVLSVLYLFFRLLMRNETFFGISRWILLFIVFASVVIPFIYLPQSNLPVVSYRFNPIFQSNSTVEEPFDEGAQLIYSSWANSNPSQPIAISAKMVLLFIYLTGVFISLVLLTFSIFSVLQLFRKSRKTIFDSKQVIIHNTDIPAFSFRRRIVISQHDYNTNAEAILTHEVSHIRLGHFYDLMLMEMVKIIYWFNPLVYLMGRDLKNIHEFQADEHTLHSGIDSTQYQLLIIQKCVGRRSFALANSFNHCQIKKRITMMNKSKCGKAWCWKVATFLPLLALLLMAFGKRGEVLNNVGNPLLSTAVISSAVASAEPIQNQYEQFKRKIEIKKDGNYINNEQYSLQEIASKGQEWYKASNDWIFLLVDESIPLSRVDEVRGALGHSYWIVQSTINSDELVYFAGDVSETAKFSQGTFNEWIESQLDNYPEAKSIGKYSITFSFVIGKNGKVRDGHIVKKSDHSEINAAYEKILTQIPDWEPAKRGGESVSVYNYIMRGSTIVSGRY